MATENLKTIKNDIKLTLHLLNIASKQQQLGMKIITQANQMLSGYHHSGKVSFVDSIYSSSSSTSSSLSINAASSTLKSTDDMPFPGDLSGYNSINSSSDIPSLCSLPVNGRFTFFPSSNDDKQTSPLLAKLHKLICKKDIDIAKDFLEQAQKSSNLNTIKLYMECSRWILEHALRLSTSLQSEVTEDSKSTMTINNGESTPLMSSSGSGDEKETSEQRLKSQSSKKILTELVQNNEPLSQDSLQLVLTKCFLTINDGFMELAKGILKTKTTNSSEQQFFENVVEMLLQDAKQSYTDLLSRGRQVIKNASNVGINTNNNAMDQANANNNNADDDSSCCGCCGCF